MAAGYQVPLLALTVRWLKLRSEAKIGYYWSPTALIGKYGMVPVLWRMGRA